MAHGGKREGAGRKPGPTMPAKLELAELAKGKAQAALDTLAEICSDNAQPGSARVSAAVAILDRGYGRPFQALHHAGHDGGAMASLDPTKLSLAALIELQGAMRDEAPSTNES